MHTVLYNEITNCDRYEGAYTNRRLMMELEGTSKWVTRR